MYFSSRKSRILKYLNLTNTWYEHQMGTLIKFWRMEFVNLNNWSRHQNWHSASHAIRSVALSNRSSFTLDMDMRHIWSILHCETCIFWLDTHFLVRNNLHFYQARFQPNVQVLLKSAQRKQNIESMTILDSYGWFLLW